MSAWMRKYAEQKFTYDSLNRITKIEDDRGVTELTYDERGMVASNKFTPADPNDTQPLPAASEMRIMGMHSDLGAAQVSPDFDDPMELISSKELAELRARLNGCIESHEWTSMSEADCTDKLATVTAERDELKAQVERLTTLLDRAYGDD